MPDTRAQLLGYIEYLYYDEHTSPIVPQALSRGYACYEVPEAARHPGYVQFASNDIQTPQVSLRGGAPPLVVGAPIVSPLLPGRTFGAIPPLPWMQPPQAYPGSM